MFYLLRDGGRFYHALVEFITPTYRNDTRRLLYELAKVWNGYLRGQLILCLFIGVLVFIAATVLGLPNPLVLGLISGLLEFIPNLGPFLALIPATLLALVSQSSTMPFLEGPIFALVVIIVWTAIQNIEAIIVVPHVMGGSLNLHPVIILVGVLVGASLAGALGVILAAPTIASARVLGHYLYGKLTDQEMFPAVPIEAELPPAANTVKE
jgi:predicted PurR-regulated permease PerM